MGCKSSKPEGGSGDGYKPPADSHAATGGGRRADSGGARPLPPAPDAASDPNDVGLGLFQAL